jgi:hypothetical protein
MMGCRVGRGCEKARLAVQVSDSVMFDKVALKLFPALASNEVLSCSVLSRQDAKKGRSKPAKNPN